MPLWEKFSLGGAFLFIVLPSYFQKDSFTVVPLSILLSSEIIALCNIAPCLTIESPSPVPPILREWLLSTR